MRYAIVADIHGNLIALKAVLNDIYKNKVDKIILLGDYYFDFPWTNEIVDLIRNIKNSYAVKGNKEDYLKNLENQDQSSWTHEQFAPLYWNFKQLSVKSREFLYSLPESSVIQAGKYKIYIAHSPQTHFGRTVIDSLNGVNYRNILLKHSEFTHEDYLLYAKNLLLNDPVLNDLLSGFPKGIYLFGHYHTQWYAEISGKLLINPGSCGQPMDNENTYGFDDFMSIVNIMPWVVIMKFDETNLVGMWKIDLFEPNKDSVIHSVFTPQLGTYKGYEVVVIFARYQNKWLYGRAKSRDVFEMIGGGIQIGETPLEAAKRELYKETTQTHNL